MSYTDVVSRISQIQSEIADLQTAFDPAAAAASAATQSDYSDPSLDPSESVSGTSFADALAQAQSTTAGSTAAANSPSTGGAGLTSVAGSGLSSAARGMLTSDQQQFATRLAQDTGLDPQVIAAWLLAEESGGAAQSRQAADNNDWLNIGYTDSGTYGSSDSVWGNAITAADATAGWLKGQDTIPGYGTASSGIQAILNTAGQSPQAQISALQNSGWAGSGYPDLPALYQEVSS
jgi:hypothetical protein